MDSDMDQADSWYRLLVEMVEDYAIIMMDVSGRIMTWNLGARRIKGFEASEVIGKHFSFFFTEEDIRAGKPQIELDEALRAGRLQAEGWRKRKDGKRFWASIVMTALYDADGQLVGYGKVTHDLTERKLAEDRLRRANAELERQQLEYQRSQAFVDSILENIPSMVFVKDARDLRFVRFNRAGEELLGFDRKELLGKNDYDFFPKDHADFFTRKDREVLAGKAVVDIPDEPIQTRAKGLRYLHTRKIPILNPQGHAEYLLGISDDITEWKKAHEERLQVIREQTALEERERAAARTAFLAEATTVLASSLDYKETLQKLAQMALPGLGDWCTITVVEEDTKRKERVALFHKDPRKGLLLEELDRLYPVESSEGGSVDRVIQQRKTLLMRHVSEADLVAMTRDDRHRELVRALGCSSYLIVPIESGGKVRGAMAFVAASPDWVYDSHDMAIAEELGRRASVAIENAFLYEQAQKAIRARDEFLSIASHELKTPITSLKLQLQITRRNTRPEENVAPSPEKLAKVLDGANAQINRLTALIDDLLDVSRIEAGKLALRFERVDLANLVREVADRYREHFAVQGCALRLDTPAVAYVNGDRYRLEQVVLNLLTNAGKYGVGKPIDVQVLQSGSSVRLVCRDYGIGIPEDKIERVFERFERVGSSDNVSGLGLGLYISSEIVKAHGGKIEVESKPGQGSCFSVSLPAAS